MLRLLVSECREGRVVGAREEWGGDMGMVEVVRMRGFVCTFQSSIWMNIG